MNEQAITYDELPYVSLPFKASHPQTLAVTAAFAGLTTAPVDDCRVLEVGCAGGGHIVPMASVYPRSRFVGVDLSPRQIEQAKALAAAGEVANVQLHARDIRQFTPDGEFDYIIIHGIYSWVPAAVRERLLEVCGNHLAPSGVAFVSYMVYPGAYVYCALRHAMQLAIRAAPGADMAATARRAIEFLAEVSPKAAPRWGPVVAKWAKDLRIFPDHFLLHDQLEGNYFPVFFTEFVEHAAAHRLQYLADASPEQRSYSDKAGEQMDQLSRDPVVQIQFADIAGFRMFRQSVLCRAGTALNKPDPLRLIETLHIASDKLLLDAKAAQSGAADTAPPGSMAHAALSVLSRRWPRTITFSQLVGEMNDPNANGADRRLVRILYRLYEIGRIEFWTREPTFIDDGADPTRAKTTKLIRAQAATGAVITNLRHDAFTGEHDQARRIIASLDGSELSADAIAHVPALARSSILFAG